MESDLNFLIKSLSQTNSSLWSTYSRAQLMDMRDSFITLQELLRSNPMAMEQVTTHPIRFKAGGNTGAKPLVADMPLEAEPQMNYQFGPNSVLVSMPSHSSLNSLYSIGSMGNNSICSISSDSCDSRKHRQHDFAGQGDNDSSSTSIDDLLALVPYKEQNTSRELVRYTNDDEMDDGSDSETLRGSGSSSSIESINSLSGSGARTRGSSSIGQISISIPMKMECVWHNSDYEADSTDSDATLIPDGFKYVETN